MQIFTILGTVRRIARNQDEVDEVAIPFVYALLTSKSSEQYTEVLEWVQTAATEYHIEFNFENIKIMSDFELGILNACTVVFQQVPKSCCFFHLGQNIYRHV